MPTELQKTAFNIKLKTMKAKKPVIMGRILKEAGYKDATVLKPNQVTKSKGWQQLLAQYDEKPIMDLIYLEAMSIKDKRNATENRKLLLTLKDRFPDKKLKITAYDERNEVVG